MAGGDRRRADFQLVVLLAAGKTVVEIAKETGISERTIYRRLQDPAFRTRLAEARDQITTQALGMLIQTQVEAATALRGLVVGKGVPPTARLGASRAVFELGQRLRETQELADRIEALEQRLDVRNVRPGRFAR